MSRGMQKKKTKGGKPATLRPRTIQYICLECDEKEDIPYKVVREFDLMDGGDPTVPPQFACEKCGGAMYPEYYKGAHGFEYKISDVR